MTYRELLTRLNKLDKMFLDDDVEVYDYSNDCFPEIACFADELHHRELISKELLDNCLILT